MSDSNSINSGNIDSLFAERRVLTVSELSRNLKIQLERDYAGILVEGEISNFSAASSGHWYFNLKDANAVVRAVFFKNANRLTRFKLQNGLSVIVRGKLTIYESRGDYQILVESVEPVGVGALQYAFEQQVKRLRAEGLFDATRKRKLPMLPRRIGIVTSPTGAAIRDMLQILERRNAGLDIVIAPVRVQGEGASKEIADAIRYLNQLAEQPGQVLDAIIIGRGGGSMEDLWAFNEEAVARAVHQSAVPVISAVGHETDFTIADYVADLRAATPSAAAELVSSGATDLMMRVDDLDESLKRSIQYYLLRRRTHWRSLIDSRALTETASRVARGRRRLDDLKLRVVQALAEKLRRSRLSIHQSQIGLARIDLRRPLNAGATRINLLDQTARLALDGLIAINRERFAHLSGKLNMLSPLAVLERGYTMSVDETGHPLTSAVQIIRGQKLMVRFADGEADCEVVDIKLKAK